MQWFQYLLVIPLAAAACLPCAIGCTPAKAPPAVDVVTLAVAAVDQALAIAIEVTPADAGPANAVWETRVQTLEKAAAVVKAAGNACTVLPSLASLAADLKCDTCLTAVSTAEKELKCQ